MDDDLEESAPLPYVDVESRMIASEAPFNHLTFCSDSFKEDLLRSQYVKRDIYDLKPQAKMVLDELLIEPTMKENRAIKADLAKWVMEKSMINTELPKLQMTYIKSEREGRFTNTTQVNVDQVRVSPDEMREFLSDAMEVEREIQAEKLKRLKAGGENEGK